jgi:hypothetical protein
LNTTALLLTEEHLNLAEETFIGLCESATVSLRLAGS